MPLTGGYRRIPILQVGADIYCDTQLIARELERRSHEPTLFPARSAGLAAMIGGWADSRFFTAGMTVTLGGMGDRLPEEFIRDREAMAGSRFSLEKIRAGLPVMREQLRAQLDWVETQLADGRDFLTGAAPGWADINAYFNAWFIRTSCPAQTGVIDAFEHVPEWAARLDALGHGQPEPITGEQALAAARDCEPQTTETADPGEPNGLTPGDHVAVMTDDYAKEVTTGRLVSSSPQHVAIARDDEQVGAVVVHFPRAGYSVTRTD